MAEAPLLVRPASAAEAAELERLASAAGLAFSAGEFERPSSSILVAERAGSLLGFGNMQLLADEAEIFDVAVAAAHRRQGIGQRLVLALVQQAGARGAKRILLEVRRGNSAAIALYERAGFGQVGERLRYYQDGEDALLLARSFEEQP